MTNDRGKSEIITHMSKFGELFPDFHFHNEEWDSWGYNSWLVVLATKLFVGDCPNISSISNTIYTVSAQRRLLETA